MTVELKLAELVLDDSVQPRVTGLDRKYIADLKGTDPGDWPPITVVRLPGGSFGVLDGFHRAVAAHEMGLESLQAEVVSEVDDPQGHAFALNAQHGLHLTRADRRAEALRLHDLHPEMSHRSIARAVGLHHATIGRLLSDSGAKRQGSGQPPTNTLPGLDSLAQTLVRQSLKLFDSRGLLTRTSTHDSHIAQAVADELEYQLDDTKKALAMARRMAGWATRAVELLEAES